MLKTIFAGVAAAALLTGFAQAADLKFQPDKDSNFHWKSYHDFAGKNDLKGQKLTIFGPWRGQDQDLFMSVVAYFEKATGAKVDYSSSENYEQQIVIDTQAGSPPNIAILPQPGLIADLASKGLLTPLGKDAEEFVRKNYAAGDSWVGFGKYPGKDGKEHFYAFPYKADLKSLVWYVPQNFKDAGYKVPEDHGGAEGSDEADRRRRRHAVVHRAWLRRRHRLAGDRLGRGHPAAPAAAERLRQVDDERNQVHRSAHRRRDQGVRLVRQESRSSSPAVRRPLRRPTSATRRTACSRCRRSASCTSRHSSSPTSSPRTSSSART